MSPPTYIPADDPDVVAVTTAIHDGDLAMLEQLLANRPALVTARFGSPDGASRTVLHVATDWPGNFPRVGATIRSLLAAGADPNARFAGNNTETPLHWAASSDDVEAIDALLEAGAKLETPGGVLTDGPPLDDAVIFGQLAAARRLVAAGAVTQLFHAAALDLVSRLQDLLATPPTPTTEDLTAALWHACRNGSTGTAQILLAAGGDPRWMGWDDLTPLAAARQHGDPTLVELLETAIRDGGSPASSS